MLLCSSPLVYTLNMGLVQRSLQLFGIFGFFLDLMSSIGAQKGGGRRRLFCRAVRLSLGIFVRFSPRYTCCLYETPTGRRPFF